MPNLSALSRGTQVLAAAGLLVPFFTHASAVERLRGVVDDGLRAARWSRPPVWLHGDPHPWNLVHRDGRLAGLVDFGDVCAGDPASDLAGAWLAFDADQRSRFRAVVGTL